MDYATDIANFTEILNKIADVVNLSDSEREDMLHVNVNTYSDILTNKKAPKDGFIIVAYGTFKETYLPIGYAHKFVIKFASWENQTEQEIEIINLAKANDLDCFFVPTFYTHINSEELPISYLEEDGDPYYYWYNSEAHTTEKYPSKSYKPLTLTDICVQPLVKTSYDTGQTNSIMGTTFYTKAERQRIYKQHPLTVNANPVLFETAEKLAYKIDDYNWWQLAIDLYGIDKCLKLVDFISTYGINDLHADNRGYMTLCGVKMPVILDWLSKEKEYN